jgi:hypothetical protein
MPGWRRWKPPGKIDVACVFFASGVSILGSWRLDRSDRLLVMNLSEMMGFKAMTSRVLLGLHGVSGTGL